MMRHALFQVLLAALIAATPATAQSVFDGTWKSDIASAQLPDKPFVTTLTNGTYTCDSCTPPYSVPADGAFHPVKGQSYYDELAVQVVDPHTVIYRSRKAGKDVSTETDTIGPDGKTLTYKTVDTSAPDGRPVNSTGEQLLVTPGPAGSYASSGGWRTTRLTDVTNAALTVAIKADPNNITMNWGTGLSVTAAWDGPAVAIQGDMGGTTAAFEKIGDRGFRRTQMRDGKIVEVRTYNLSADGKTLAVVAEDKQQGTTTRFNFIRQ